MARVAQVNFEQEIDGDTFGTKRFNFFSSDGVTELDLSDATAKVQIRKGGYAGKLRANGYFWRWFNMDRPIFRAIHFRWVCC